MSAAYSTLPTTDPHANGYPPTQVKALLSRLSNAAPPTRLRRLLIFVAVLVLSSILLVYVLYSPSFSFSGSGSYGGGYGGGGYNANYLDNNDQGGIGRDGPNSPFFRDAHPALHTRLFLARAQAEIKARGLDTCSGQLSARMVAGYVEGAVPYCAATSGDKAAGPAITCFSAGGASSPNSPNKWWPYPQSFCTSQALAHTPGWGGDVPVRGMFTGKCEVTNWGADLKSAMGREVFLGTEFTEVADRRFHLQDKNAGESCDETLTHPTLFIHRQDRWNPFHVGEDLVTTFLALTIFSRQPSAATSTPGLQIVFQDEYLPTASLFAPLYDRIGAFPPRRMAAEGLGNTCLARAFHSIGAGASLLSATGVGRAHTCASELVWGAGLWLRWLWGLEALPGGVEPGRVGADPVQVLFLSREKFDAHAHPNHKLTAWQEARNINNEHALVAGLREGLAGLCRVVTPVVGMEGTANERRWEVDANLASANASALHARAGSAPRALRFATLNPTASALPTQIASVGRANVVVNVHARALGLTLFMPTGRASVVELLTDGAQGVSIVVFFGFFSSWGNGWRALVSGGQRGGMSHTFSKRCRESRCRAMGRCATRLAEFPLPLSFPSPSILVCVNKLFKVRFRNFTIRAVWARYV
ncbi:hypothetical protein K438DRAFT_1556411 [Mycena galopus ATCC 62051]|nr:hypothetical protein K438DRAFT_1556411 [Mycena galopus ATCC 62051]